MAFSNNINHIIDESFNLNFEICACSMQSPVVKKYPAELSLTGLMCMLGAVQSGVLALICEYKTPSVWAIGWNIELLSYVYTV